MHESGWQNTKEYDDHIVKHLLIPAQNRFLWQVLSILSNRTPSPPNNEH